jgi:hypothetical protein
LWRSKSTQVIQVGIIVEDVEETAKKLENLIGIGPFRIFEPEYKDLTYRGKTGRFKVKIGLAMAGTVQIELVQPLSGKTIYGEYVKRKGYGLHHLGIRADNMSQSVRKMNSKGFKVIQSGNRPGTGWAYLDCEDEAGIVFELVAHGKRSQCVINDG